jgi:hypothetical protein
MEHEAEPGPAEAVGQDTAGASPGTGGETAPVEAAEATGGAVVPAEQTASIAAVPAEQTASIAAVPAEQATGDARVDAALKLLDRLPGLPVSDHPELFEQVHARLSEVLGELESGPGAAGPVAG